MHNRIQRRNAAKKSADFQLPDDRVREEIESLPVDMKARFRRIVDLIQGYGLERVREPHVKHLEGALWEMRMKGRDGISRAVYVTARGRRPGGCCSGFHQENAENSACGN